MKFLFPDLAARAFQIRSLAREIKNLKVLEVQIFEFFNSRSGRPGIPDPKPGPRNQKLQGSGNPNLRILHFLDGRARHSRFEGRPGKSKVSEFWRSKALSFLFSGLAGQAFQIRSPAWEIKNFKVLEAQTLKIFVSRFGRLGIPNLKPGPRNQKFEGFGGPNF